MNTNFGFYEIHQTRQFQWPNHRARKSQSTNSEKEQSIDSPSLGYLKAQMNKIDEI